VEPVTGIAIVDWVLGLLGVAGYPIVFGVTVFENLFVIGGITPGETIVVAAAFLSTPKYGSLHWPFVWIASVAGTIIGSNISYFLGRKGGRDALLRYGHRFHISEKRIGAAEEYFARYGSKTVLIGRFTAGFKNFTPMIAGVSRMKLPWFELYTVIGAMLYTSAMVLIGYFLGENFDRAMSFVAGVGYVGMGVFLIFVASLFIAYRRRRVRRALEDEFEEAAEERAAVEESQLPVHDEKEPGADERG
jgi:undecaprenyl-diphosphatase